MYRHDIQERKTKEYSLQKEQIGQLLQNDAKAIRGCARAGEKKNLINHDFSSNDPVPILKVLRSIFGFVLFINKHVYLC